MYLSHYIQEHPFSVVIRMLIQLLPNAVRYLCVYAKAQADPPASIFLPKSTERRTKF